ISRGVARVPEVYGCAERCDLFHRRPESAWPCAGDGRDCRPEEPRQRTDAGSQGADPELDGAASRGDENVAAGGGGGRSRTAGEQDLRRAVGWQAGGGETGSGRLGADLPERARDAKVE